MSYPKSVVRLAPSRGVIRDLPPHDVPEQFFTGCRNVMFRRGLAQRLLGSREAYGTALQIANPAQLMHALNTQAGSINYWLLFEEDGTAWSIESDNALPIDNMLLTSQPNPYQHSSALLNGIPIYNNALDEPVYWDGSLLQTLPGWTATESAQFIAVFKYHIFAMNTSGPGGSFPNEIKWSDAAPPGSVPGSWTPASNNEAGFVELSDTPGPILCAYPMGDGLMVYKKSAMHYARYTPNNNVFTFKTLRTDIGALTPRAVCDIGGQHFVVTDGDIVITNGTSKRSVGEQRYREFLFSQVSQENYLNLFCVFNKSRNEVLVAYPANGAAFCNRALIYDVANDAFGERDLDDLPHAAVGLVNDAQESNVWADRTDLWQDALDVWGASSIQAARDSLVHVEAQTLRQQDTSDSVVMPASLTRGGLTFGQPERVKFVKRVHVLKGANSGELFIRLTSKMTPNGPETAYPEVRLPSGEQVVNTQAVGRYIGVQIRSNNGTLWSITGIELEADLRGYH